MNSIQALIAPPGAGKTTWLINHLQSNRHQHSVLAFPTKHLSAEVQRRLSSINLAFNAIDSDTVDGSVIQCLEQNLANRTDKIIICTHESLRFIKADTLNGWHLYVDEVPTTWDCDTLNFNELSYRAVLQTFAGLTVESDNRLSIKQDCKKLIEDLATHADSALSSDARKLLKTLLDEGYIVEVDKLDSKQTRTVRIVGVKHYIPAFEAAATTIIMGAEIEKTLLGVILKGAGWHFPPWNVGDIFNRPRCDKNTRNPGAEKIAIHLRQYRPLSSQGRALTPADTRWTLSQYWISTAVPSCLI